MPANIAPSGTAARRDGVHVFRQVSWLEASSVKAALSRPTGLTGAAECRINQPIPRRKHVDGQDLARVNLESFYRQVAYIPQDPPILDGSLRENLTFNERVNVSCIQEVLEKVGLDDLIRRLPAGLETIVGERGIKLSGGERQRLAFGRVFIQDPKFVIMDEPTSALDCVTESFVTQNMTQLFKGKTVIIIAHRLQSVKDADQILVLENGQVIQQGSFETLVMTAGKFQQLWETQTTIRSGK